MLRLRCFFRLLLDWETAKDHSKMEVRSRRRIFFDNAIHHSTFTPSQAGLGEEIRSSFVEDYYRP